MDKNKLKEKILELGIRSNMYSLEGKLKEDACIMYESAGKWYVFYYERGDRYLEKVFKKESDACNYFLDLLKRHVGIK